MVMPIARGHIDLDTRVGYAIGVVEFEDLYELMVAGHSYGTVVFTGAADRVPVVITPQSRQSPRCQPLLRPPVDYVFLYRPIAPGAQVQARRGSP
jgi:hypothetical protein